MVRTEVLCLLCERRVAQLLSVGLGPSHDSSCWKKLRELDVPVEEQMNNVLISLRLWIKSFIFNTLTHT